MSDAHPDAHPDAHDERLALPLEQCALLWCMRVWVVGLNSPVDADARIEDMMHRLGVPEAAPYLEGFMFAIRHGAARTIAVDCTCRTSVSEDERALLDVLGLAQESRPFEALLLLRGLVTSEGARAALHSAEGLGMALARVGRFLPAPDDEVCRFAMGQGANSITGRPSTLH